MAEASADVWWRVFADLAHRSRDSAAWILRTFSSENESEVGSRHSHKIKSEHIEL